MVTATSDIINKLIIKQGDFISQAINTYPIQDISIDQKTSGVHIKANITNIKQNIDIHWKANILNVKDTHSFVINSKNVGFHLTGKL